MRKKQTQIAKVQKLLSESPDISAKDMALKLKMPIDRVYILRSVAKRNNRIAVAEGSQPKPSRVGRAKKYRENLEAENLKLTEWTMLWKQKYEKLEEDYTRAKVMYLDSQAIVHYLEEKVLTLLKGKQS